MVAAPPSLPSDKLSLKHLSSFPLRKTRNNTSTFNESCTLPRHPNLLNVPTPSMNAVVRRSSIGILVLLFSELSKVRIDVHVFVCYVQTRSSRATHVVYTRTVYCHYRKSGLLCDTAPFPFNCIAYCRAIKCRYETKAIIEFVILFLAIKRQKYN